MGVYGRCHGCNPDSVVFYFIFQLMRPCIGNKKAAQMRRL
ncbi:hypothetical protein NEISICOT_00216 [Neisseria sicca ATCC 29256]|uniref:Uncharacterized protein n=1 Tax=Neisseria sicca ATCC 29256 TaxID=547045 RepID=C6M137_NEISI|nr:hypothetical protein NEISICOT_00216 [Neisseria sicca ATCC 29256]